MPLFLLLCACAPNAREPDGLALARVLGVDGTGGRVTLTAVCGGDEGEAGLRGSASGHDFASARSALPWTGEKELALTGLSYLIIGNGCDLEAVASAVLDDRELSPGASVWLTDDAADLLERCDDPAARLAVLEERGIKAPTAAEALAMLTVDGEAVLPVLVWDGEQVTNAGTFLWRAAS